MFCLATSCERSLCPFKDVKHHPGFVFHTVLNTNSRHPLIHLYWDHHSLYQRVKRKVEKGFSYFVIKHQLPNNCESKFDILEEWGHKLWMAKSTPFVGCLWFYTETWWELRPEPTSANYAFSDLKHTNTDNCELNSLSPPNYPFSPPPALSPQLSLKHSDNHLLPDFEVTLELSEGIINWLSAKPLFEHLWSSTW